MKEWPLKIGITGGIGAGKTLVTKIFQVLGVPIYDADSRAKWLMSNQPQLIADIRDLLGKETYTGEILNTRWVASRVFQQPQLLEKLNALVHPAVGRDFETWAAQPHQPYVLKEAALLFESGSYKQLDRVITVSAPLEIRLNRLKKRDPQRDKAQILSIIEKQMPEEVKIDMASEVIYNDDAHLLIPQVLEIHQKYLQIAGPAHS